MPGTSRPSHNNNVSRITADLCAMAYTTRDLSEEPPMARTQSQTGPSPRRTALALERYFAETGKGPAHQRAIAYSLWGGLTPAERRALQTESSRLARDDVALSSLYTQSVLVLEHVSRAKPSSAQPLATQA